MCDTRQSVPGVQSCLGGPPVESGSLSGVQRAIDGYLASFAANPPARHKARFKGWKSDLPNVKTDDLAVVSWLQDTASREVLQAHYVDVQP